MYRRFVHKCFIIIPVCFALYAFLYMNVKNSMLSGLLSVLYFLGQWAAVMCVGHVMKSRGDKYIKENYPDIYNKYINDKERFGGLMPPTAQDMRTNPIGCYIAADINKYKEHLEDKNFAEIAKDGKSYTTYMILSIVSAFLGAVIVNILSM